PGVLNSYVQDLLELKKKTSTLILEKLRAFCAFFQFSSHSRSIPGEAAKVKISRMFYRNFEDSITDKYGVVVENWPLKMFCSPSDVKSRNEVQVLYRAWESGTARFRRMSSTEWAEWQENRFRNAMAEMAPTISFNNGNDSPMPDVQGTASGLLSE